MAAVGTVGPRQDRLLVLKRRPAEAVAAQYAPAEGPRPTPSTSKPPSTRTTALYRPGRDGAPKPTWPDARSPSPTGCSKPAATAPGPPSGPSSPGKPAPCSTRCSEPNGTVPPAPVRQANGNNLSPGPTLRPALGCRASTCSAGELPRVRHNRGPCPQQRRRDRSLDRTERSKHSNGYHRSGYRCPPDIPGSRHADAHRPRKVRASRKSSSERTAQWRGMHCSAPVRRGLSYGQQINVRCRQPLIDQDIMRARTESLCLELKVHNADYAVCS